MITTYANVAIDTVQSIKKIAVDQLVTDKSIKESCNTFIEAQSAFAKTLAKAAEDFFTVVYDNAQQTLSACTAAK